MTAMVMTILEARVAPDRADDLEREYSESIAELPREIVQTYLVRDAVDMTRYRIVTIWESRAALEAVRSSGQTPRGVQMFQTVGAKPEVSILEVVLQERR